MPNRTQRTTRSRHAIGVIGLAAGLSLMAGCKSFLDVDNPNNVSDNALNDPTAAAAILNGAENTTGNGLSSLYNAYVPATDEAIQTGSRDDYRLLDTGVLDVNTNEYVQAGYLNVMRARWMAEQAIGKLTKFNADGQLKDKSLLARAYLNGAVIYTAIADSYDDVAISDRTQAGKNVGEANMSIVYDSALKWLDAGAALSSGGLRTNIVAMRARVRHAKAVWKMLNPPGTVPANPLVNDPAATADAQAALAGLSGDARYDVLTIDLNEGDGASGGFGFEMNSRVEYTPSDDLIELDPTNSKPRIVNGSVVVVGKDPVTGLPDATVAKMINRIVSAINHPPFTQVSSREMYLILAEAALAAGNTAGFDSNINALRALDGKAAYTGTGPTRLQLLQWERRVNLLFQGRRLNDMYRFGVRDPRWVSTSIAVKKPGCRLPFPLVERESNKLITGPWACQQ